MRHIIATSIGALGLAVALSTTASAQEQPYLEQHVLAPSDALELKVGTGYTQGFGTLAPGRPLDNVAGAGLGVSTDLDYRLSIPLSIGIEGQYQEFGNAQNASSRGLAMNLGATYHFMPVLRGDPWLRLGTGYRLVWENDPVGAPGITVLRHGFDVATAKVGYDVRLSQDVAIGPVVGADLNVFLWQDATDTGSHALASAEVGTFVYAGLQGRFDIGGARTDNTTRPTMGVTAPQPESPPTTPPLPEEQVYPVSPSVNVSEEIMKACEIQLNNVNDAPKFAFDRSFLTSTDEVVLEKVARCFSTGPLKGASMRLIGRADPRGSVAYNDALGMRRADSVASFVERYGVEATRVDRESRGKRDARGHDEATWRIDRRVDILRAR